MHGRRGNVARVRSVSLVSRELFLSRMCRSSVMYNASRRECRAKCRAISTRAIAYLTSFASERDEEVREEEEVEEKEASGDSGTTMR